MTATTTTTATMMTCNDASIEKEQKDNIIMLFLRAEGMKSDKVGNILGAADSFFEVSNSDGEVVGRSNILFNDSTPKWAPIKLDLEALCDHDDQRRVSISFYDYQTTGQHTLIKTVETSVQGMKESAKSYQEQSRVSLSETTPSFEFGDWVSVYIYDAFVTVGAATRGTLIKKPFEPKVAVTVATASDSSACDDDSTDECIGRIISINSDEPSISPVVRYDDCSSQAEEEEELLSAYSDKDEDAVLELELELNETTIDSLSDDDVASQTETEAVESYNHKVEQPPIDPQAYAELVERYVQDAQIKQFGTTIDDSDEDDLSVPYTSTAVLADEADEAELVSRILQEIEENEVSWAFCHQQVVGR